MVVILGRALHSYLGSVVLGWRECWRINSVALEEEIEFLDGIVTSGGQGQLFFCSMTCCNQHLSRGSLIGGGLLPPDHWKLLESLPTDLEFVN